MRIAGLDGEIAVRIFDVGPRPSPSHAFRAYAALYVVERAAHTQGANLGFGVVFGMAKNHVIVMEDADLEMTAHDIVRSSMGCAGQRCMAVHVMIAVGNTQSVIDRVLEIAKEIKTGSDMGAVISGPAVKRIVKYIDDAESAGADILLDGRGVEVIGKYGISLNFLF